MFFGPEYKELNSSGTFKVVSRWNVTNPDVSLKVLNTERDRYEMHNLVESSAASGLGSYTILHFCSSKFS